MFSNGSVCFKIYLNTKELEKLNALDIDENQYGVAIAIATKKKIVLTKLKKLVFETLSLADQHHAHLQVASHN